MKVKVYKPKNDHIVKLIDRYIFIEDSSSESIEMTCFPNNNYCFGIMLNSELKKNNKDTLLFEYSQNHTHYLTGIYTKPIKFNFEGKTYRELCIDLKPMAFTLFGEKKLNKSKFEYQPFKDKSQFDIEYLTNIALETFESKDHPVNALDHYFLSRLKEDFFEEYNTINSLQNKSINDFKQTLLKSERGIYRFFAENLGISPHKFLSIQSFQTCIAKLQHEHSIIDIAHNIGLTDGSHINKLFKKYSGLSPSQFKKEVSSFNSLLLKI